MSPAQGTDCNLTSHLPPCCSLSSDLLSLFVRLRPSPRGCVPNRPRSRDTGAIRGVCCVKCRLPACLPACLPEGGPARPARQLASSLGSALPASPSLLASGLRSPRRPGLGALLDQSRLPWLGSLVVCTGGRGGLKILFLTTQEDPDALRAVGPSPPPGWQTAGLLGAESGALSLRGLDCPSVALPSARLAPAQG